jgi:hypothetical protein
MYNRLLISTQALYPKYALNKALSLRTFTYRDGQCVTPWCPFRGTFNRAAEGKFCTCHHVTAVSTLLNWVTLVSKWFWTGHCEDVGGITGAHLLLFCALMEKANTCSVPDLFILLLFYNFV